MAKNPPKGAGRVGSVKNRKQVFNPKTKHWVKIDTESRLFMNQASKKHKKFKGVSKHK